MKKIRVINGPNMNLLGRRQPEIYGSATLEGIEKRLIEKFPEVQLEFFQSNHEGEIIDLIQGFEGDGIVLNAAAYSHTSLAIADAISSVDVPVVEVHLSNVFSREEIRRKSLMAPVCRGVVAGFGEMSYELAVRALIV